MTGFSSFFTARTAGPDDTRRLAAKLTDELVDGDVVVLTGDLGAGKTCFTQGLGQGLGVEDRITSPTFTLANRYSGGGEFKHLELNHLDVYRLESPSEVEDLGLSELFEGGVTVVEWGDRIADVLPATHLQVHLRYPPLTSTEPVLGDEEEFVAPVERTLDFQAQACSDWPTRGLQTHLGRWATA